MTAYSVRAMLIALAAAGLAGCIDARSEYAPYAGYAPPPPSAPFRPQYPVTDQAEQARPAAPEARASSDADESAPANAPSRGVGAQALPPISDAPAQRTPTSAPHGGMTLTPLVWRSDAQPVEQIDVARHRRTQPQADSDAPPSRHGRHARGRADTTDADTTSSRRGRHARGRAEADSDATTSRHGRHARGRHEPASEATHTIVVHKGDTIDSIADRLATDPETLIKTNRLRHPRDLDVGRKLKVPTSEGYVIKPGDTLYSIGRRFDVPVAALKDLNGLGASNRLHVGQKIDLPGQAPEPQVEERPAKPTRATRQAPGRRSTPPVRPHETVEPTFPAPVAAAPVEAPPTVPAAPTSSALPPVAPEPATTTVSPPDHPIPYSALPGRLATPPRTVAPSRTYAPAPYNPPATLSGSMAPEVTAPPSDTQVTAAGRGRFIWPVQGNLLTGFGSLPGGQRNDGVDIAAADGTPVRSAASGDVVYAGNLVPGFGNLVLIKHEDGWVTAYAHLSRTEVKIKDHVAQGQEIGTVGSSGGVGQPQLHFEVRYAPSPRERARPVDPSLVLSGQP
jgi:murein DD-endopeptidase MepM/ murein hydrolase activator NlpD